MGRKAKLTPETWLDTGLNLLRDQGPGALRAERVAAALRTTKGSFYWFFGNVDAYLVAICDRWRDLNTAPEIADPIDAAAARAQLLHYWQGAAFWPKDSATDPRLELAMRGWATAFEPAARAVAGMDKARLDGLNGALAALGLTNPDFAQLLLDAAVGQLPDPGRGGTLRTLVDLILALE